MRQIEPSRRESQASPTQTSKKSKRVQQPSITLPKGGAIKGIDEKFTVNPATGTTSLTEPFAKSTAQYDAGVFEMNFRDERYIPFEGVGAVSDWELSLPMNFRQIDSLTISDVLVHVIEACFLESWKEKGDVANHAIRYRTSFLL